MMTDYDVRAIGALADAYTGPADLMTYRLGEALTFALLEVARQVGRVADATEGAR